MNSSSTEAPGMLTRLRAPTPAAFPNPVTLRPDRTDITFDHDPQVGPMPASSFEAIDEAGVTHSDAQLEAGHPRLRDLQPRGTDGPHLADHRSAQVDAAHGEVLTERRRLDRNRE